jgi:hypothetical protein
VALAQHSGGGSAPEPAPAPVTRPTPSTRAELANADGAELDVSELAPGAPPKLGYEVGGTYHEPGGATSAVGTTAPVERMAVLADGTLVYLTRDQGNAGSTQIQIATPGAAVSAPTEAGDGLAVNTRRSLAVWMSGDGRVEGYAVDGTSLGAFSLPGKASGDSPQVLAVTGDDCGPGGSCQVLVRTTDPQTGENLSWIVTPDGGAQQQSGLGFQSLSDMTARGARVGLTGIRHDGTTCSGIAKPARPPWIRTCLDQLVSFSPDGKAVSAIASQTDGAGSTDLAAYDIGGRGVFFDHPSPANPDQQMTVQTLVWEDDTHLLATVYQEGRWSVVRFGLDGSMEVAVPGVAGDIAYSPIVLPGERS